MDIKIVAQNIANQSSNWTAKELELLFEDYGKQYTREQQQVKNNVGLDGVRRSFIRKERCTHEEWDMDNQIRTIKCRSCGKKAWVKEYKNLYQSGL